MPNNLKDLLVVIFNFVYACMSVWGHVQVSTGAHRGQGYQIPELELHTGAGYQTWVRSESSIHLVSNPC